MGINPEHAEVACIPGIQIGHRRKINETIAAQRHNPIGLMFLYRLTRRTCLSQKRRASDDPIFGVKDFARLWLRHWDGLDWAGCCRSKPGQQL
jgi:hypothetical protein